jgi:ankyrin repeat protein
MTHSIGLDYAIFDSQQELPFRSVDPDSPYSIEGQTPLIAAAFSGIPEIIQLLLENGASINARDAAGCTALVRAVCLQHTSAVKKLLIAGADRTIKSTNGANALHFACANGNVPIVKHLLEPIQPELLETLVSGFSPLALCAAAGHLECVELLCTVITSARIEQVTLDIALEAAAERRHDHIINTIMSYFEPDNKSQIFQPALLAASRSGDVVVVRQLLEFIQDSSHEIHGSFDEAAKHGHTVVMELLWAHYTGQSLIEKSCPQSEWITLTFAAEAGQLDTVGFLLDKKFQADVCNANGFTPLMAAARYGHVSIVRALLAAGASPNLATSAGDTALILAARYGYASIVQGLLGSGADINAKTVTGDLTALLFASQTGSEAVIELLLEHNLRLDARAASGFTPLLLAVQGGHTGAVRILLHAGADPNMSSKAEDSWEIREKSTRLPLELAVEGGLTEIVDLLLEQGAETERTGSRRETALGIAASSGHLDIVVRLLNAGALCLQEAFNRAYGNNHEEVIGVLSVWGVDPTHSHDSHVYWHGWRPPLRDVITESTSLDLGLTKKAWSEWPDLIGISEGGKMEDVHRHIDTGRNIDIAHSNGHTALLSAVANDLPDIVALLLANGADCNVEVDGCTALLLAAGTGNHLIVVELIMFGADTKFRSTQDRWDAYALAAFHGHVRVLEVLFDVTGETFPEYEDGYRWPNSPCLPKDAIFDAASNGHSDMVQFLLSRNIYSDFATPTLYSNAARNGHIAVISVLVSAGLDYLYAHNDDVGRYWGPEPPLIAAACGGHADIVALLLDLEPSFPEHAKAEAFSRACDYQHTAVVQEFLRIGLNPEQSFLGVDPLLVNAIKCGDVGVLESLLETSNGKTVLGPFSPRGPAIDAIDFSKTSALHHAAHCGRSDMVAALLKAGANIDLQDGDGWTALMHACHESHEDVAQLLLQHHCKTDCVDRAERSALSLACVNGLNSIVEELAKLGTDISSGVALIQAVRHNRPEVVRILVLAGVNVNTKTKDGWSALPEAARLKSLEMIQILLAAGADIETTFRTGWTALAFAARDGDQKIVDTLLDAGANPNTTVSSSYTPLSLAVRGGHLQIVRSMLKHIRSSTFTIGSALALEEAAKRGYGCMCSALLEKFGCCSNARSTSTTAAKLAELNNYAEVAETIRQHEDLWGVQCCDEKHEDDLGEGTPKPAQREIQQSIEGTVEEEFDPKLSSDKLPRHLTYDSIVSDNPLFLAIRSTDDVRATRLLDSGEADMVGDRGMTALHVACRYGNRRMAEILVNRGIDVDTHTSRVEPFERLMEQSFPEGATKALREPLDPAYTHDIRERCVGLDVNLCDSCVTLIPSIEDLVRDNKSSANEEIITTSQLLFSAMNGCPGCASALKFIFKLFGHSALSTEPMYRQVEAHNEWKHDLQNILYATRMFSSSHVRDKTFEFGEEGIGIGDIKPIEWQDRFNARKVVNGSLSWDFQTLLIKYRRPPDFPELCKYIVYADKGECGASSINLVGICIGVNFNC